jgi:hypothetical protein
MDRGQCPLKLFISRVRGRGPDMAMGTGKILTIALGAAAIVALAGGGAYFFLGSGSSDSVKIIELIDKPYTLAQTTDVLDRPMPEGRVLVRIRQGAPVTVLGVVDGDSWLQVTLPKDQLGYIPSAAIPEVASAGTPKAAPVPVAFVPPVATPPTPAPPTPTPPAATPAVTPPPAIDASAAPPASADDGPEAPPPADMVDFQAVDRQVSVVQATGLYLAPNEQAPQAYTVKPGTQVEIIAVSKDGKWGWVNVSDGTPAYLKLADLN